MQLFRPRSQSLCQRNLGALASDDPRWEGVWHRGEYLSKNEYICTYPKNGPTRESSTPWFLDTNISARTPKIAIFLHKVVIFLLGPKEKRFLCTIEQETR